MAGKIETAAVMPPNFVQRLLFWIAVFCLGYAVLTIAGWLVYLIAEGPSFFGFSTGPRWFYTLSGGLRFVFLALACLLLIGSLRLLKRQRSGAVLLVTWGLARAAVTFVQLTLQ